MKTQTHKGHTKIHFTFCFIILCILICASLTLVLLLFYFLSLILNILNILFVTKSLI